MATDPGIVEYIAEQIALGSRLTCRKMFGEYALYVDGKVVALVCDSSLYIKPSQAAVRLAAGLPQRPPYPGAKDYPLADELLDDSEALRALVLATAALMPEPKPKSSINRRKRHGAKDVRLFTLDGGQRRDPAIEEWFATLPATLGAIARSWFQVMRDAGPDVRELLHDGHPTACVGDLAFGYVASYASHVNVGFFLGAALKDPAGLMQGSGRYMRHVKVRPGVFSQAAQLRALVALAHADMSKRRRDREVSRTP